MNFKEYFDFDFKIKDNKPIFKIKIKKNLRKVFKRPDGMPMSSANVEYFVLHFGDLGNQIYEYRKKFFKLEYRIDFFKENKLISESDYQFCLNYLEQVANKTKVNHLEAMKNPEIWQKQAVWIENNREFLSDCLKNQWNDPIKREKLMKRCFAEEVKERRIKTFLKTINENKEAYNEAMANPIRKEKIGLKSKEQWENLSPEKQAIRMKKFAKSGRRNFVINNIKMNKIEFLVANFLNENNIEWLYEERIKISDKVYFPDFVLSKYKIIIECFGDYWHANNKLYENNSKMFGDVKAQEIWENDKQRILNYQNIGFKTIILWEDKILNGNFKEKIMEKLEKQFIEEEITLAEFANLFLNLNDFDNPQVVDLAQTKYDFEILSKDDEYQPLTHFVVKENVENHYQLGGLKGTSEHKVLYQDQFIKLVNHPEAKLVNESIKVVDVSVANTECYMANGQLNHNTTPGGKAIPFHASVRIALTGGGALKDAKGNIIGSHVNVTIKKNKVAPPFRKTEFNILFGRGIDENDAIFELLWETTKSAPLEIAGKNYQIAGGGAWKNLTVSTIDGEVLIDHKFYKADFVSDIMNSEKYGPSIDLMLEKLMVMDITKAKVSEEEIKKEDNYE